ncbi:hypothetical protein JZ751_001676, partial [Albula glossodonta]
MQDMEFGSKTRSVIFFSLVIICVVEVCFCVKRTNVRKSERLSPPLDIQLETVNCTAFRVRWRMPRRHVSTITGYKEVDIGNLRVHTQYRVSVGAYGWAGEGRPSMPRDVSTASH